VLLDEVQRAYPDGTPAGARWVPARLGGGAPATTRSCAPRGRFRPGAPARVDVRVTSTCLGPRRPDLGGNHPCPDRSTPQPVRDLALPVRRLARVHGHAAPAVAVPRPRGSTTSRPPVGAVIASNHTSFWDFFTVGRGPLPRMGAAGPDPGQGVAVPDAGLRAGDAPRRAHPGPPRAGAGRSAARWRRSRRGSWSWSCPSRPSRRRGDRLGLRDGPPGLLDVQVLDHAPVDGDHAAALALRLLERVDDLAGVVDLVLAGAKTRLQGSSCFGWIRVLPSKPNSRPCRHSASKPSASSRSLKTPSRMTLPASRAPSTHHDSAVSSGARPGRARRAAPWRGRWCPSRGPVSRSERRDLLGAQHRRRVSSIAQIGCGRGRRRLERLDRWRARRRPSRPSAPAARRGRPARSRRRRRRTTRCRARWRGSRPRGGRSGRRRGGADPVAGVGLGVGATASSRSRISASAGSEAAFSSARSLAPGMYSTLRRGRAVGRSSGSGPRRSQVVGLGELGSRSASARARSSTTWHCL
jgi:hypothetical protein